MQAIITKYLGATNFRGSRVKATCQAGSVTLAWDDALNPDENHDAAAHALANKLGWLDRRHAPVGGKPRGSVLVGGGLPDGSGNAYVMVST